jgi:two-component system, chemotaxis family, response regulator Rcp1
MDVLLIEDSPGDIRLAQEAFHASAKPIRLNVVVDGVEAMAFLRHEGSYHAAPRPDLILLDLKMPKMGGREVLTRIKDDVDLRAIPVIILSTSENEDDVNYCYQHHANCFIKKPEQWDEFERLIKFVNDFWLLMVKLPAGQTAEAVH